MDYQSVQGQRLIYKDVTIIYLLKKICKLIAFHMFLFLCFCSTNIPRYFMYVELHMTEILVYGERNSVL